jgi:hypothetical protein
VAKTLAQVLPQLSVFISEPGEDFNDFIFLSSNQALDINSTALLAEQTDWLKKRLVRVDKSQGQLLTDDLNPLEHLQTAKAEYYRHVLVDWFGSELLVR